MRVPWPAAITTTSIAIMVISRRFRSIIRQPYASGWRSWRGWWARLALLVCALGLGGCGQIELVYNHSPRLLQWWLDQQFDLDSEQEQQLRGELRALLAWHRQHQLPQISRSFQVLVDLSGQELSPGQVCAFQDEVLRSLPQLAQQAAARLARSAVHLRAAQITHLRRHFEDEDLKWREEWLDGSDEERLQYRFKRALERLEDYYGRLDAGQKRLLRQALRESPYHAPTAWAERQRRQNDMAETLGRVRQGQTSPQQAQQALQDLFARMLNPPVEPNRQHVLEYSQYQCTLIAKLHNAMRVEQRERARAKLEQQRQTLLRLETQAD